MYKEEALCNHIQKETVENAHQQKNELWCVHTVECYSAIKMNDIVVSACYEYNSKEILKKLFLRAPLSKLWFNRHLY
jgi:hypothetical protein